MTRIWQVMLQQKTEDNHQFCLKTTDTPQNNVQFSNNVFL